MVEHQVVNLGDAGSNPVDRAWVPGSEALRGGEAQPMEGESRFNSLAGPLSSIGVTVAPQILNLIEGVRHPYGVQGSTLVRNGVERENASTQSYPE